LIFQKNIKSEELDDSMPELKNETKKGIAIYCLELKKSESECGKNKG